MARADTQADRPLSPHLQIYRWHATMVMSILHRVTGSALFFGTLLLVWWLAAAAAGPAAFDTVNAVFGSWFGRLVLFGFTWALVLHMLGGIRHLIWDFGVGLEAPARDRMAVGTLVLSLVLTPILWIVGYALR
ncbi:MAG: succinate dehydrogenase, cytochrome b556 subunit [Alphaproteobacteria bacterium]